jgi:hypothetical protein
MTAAAVELGCGLTTTEGFSPDIEQPAKDIASATDAIRPGARHTGSIVDDLRQRSVDEPSHVA